MDQKMENIKTAKLTWKRIYGTPYESRIVIDGTGDYRIDGMVMGRTWEEARNSLVEFNARRTALGLSTFVCK